MVTFTQSKVIDSYKLDEILTIENDEDRTLFDFLPEIKPNAERKILESWEKYFTLKNIPWAVTQNEHALTFWKEKYTA